MAWKITRDLLAEDSKKHGEDVAPEGTNDWSYDQFLSDF